MENTDIISFRSVIDDSFIVTVVYPESALYADIKGMLDGIGGSIAALVVGKKMILVDGSGLEKIDEDQFKAIQAHEICHDILGHTSELSESDEIEADLSAIHLLLELEESKASESLSDRLLNQRGIKYNDHSLESILSRESLRLYRNYLTEMER